MPRIRFTDAALKALTAPANERVDYVDLMNPGFNIRVSGKTDRFQKGRKVFCYKYRYASQQRVLTWSPDFSDSPANRGLSLKEAAALYHEAKGQLGRGVDPAVAWQAQHAARKRPVEVRQSLLLTTVVDDFLADLENKGRRWSYIRGTQGHFTNHVFKHWRDRDVRDVTRTDCVALVEALVTTGPSLANHVHAALSGLFSWAAKKELIATSPMLHVERPGLEHRRRRVFDDTELTIFWLAAADLGLPLGPYFHTLEGTGLRRSEAAKAKWNDLSPDFTELLVPEQNSKNHREHIVFLPELIRAEIRACPRISDYVFAYRPHSHLNAFSEAKRKLDFAIEKRCAEFGLLKPAPWVIHDIRRSVATNMARLGVDQSTIGRVLNHTVTSVLAETYNRYSYAPEKKTAWQLWADYLSSLVEDRKTKAA